MMIKLIRKKMSKKVNINEEKISAVYKIVNTVTGDFYVGSSKNVKKRWMEHKRSSTWKAEPNKRLYQDMQEIGVDKFRFQILVPTEPENLKQVEQEFIDLLHPTYNNFNAKGLDVERHKEANRKATRKYGKKYRSQLCFYNGETLKLEALRSRFRRAGIKHPTQESKKYLLSQ
jgi:group I intron endonuclease